MGTRKWIGLAAHAGVWGLMTAGQVSGQSAPDTVRSEIVTFTVDVVATGLEMPVAMTFLPDGRAILVQRRRALFTFVDLETGVLSPLSGLPEMMGEGDGGALDIVASPSYGSDGWLYFAYAGAGASGPTTLLDRARLHGHEFVDRERLFTAEQGIAGNVHFGGRIAFVDGFLFLTIGDREMSDGAQRLDTHNGSIVRLRPDGSVPTDNPFVGVEGALPEIWTYGHRNPQGLARNPHTGGLWTNEHGPQGGDEINVVLPGRNYGWPVITYGEEYGGGPIGEGLVEYPGMEQPAYYYRPSIAPSDMVFVSGRGFPEWSSDVLVGAMALTHLNRLTLDGDRVLHEERLLGDRNWRIRMIEEGPAGELYLGTDSGLLVRLRRVNPT